MIKKVKKWCILLMLLASSSTAFSQSDFKRHEVAVGYGFVPSSDFIDAFSDGLVSAFTGFKDKNKRSMGSISLMYNYHLNKTFGIGGVISYSHRSKDWVNNDNQGDLIKQKFDYITIMPRVKGDWIHGRIFTLYSAVSAGMVIYKDKFGNESDTSVKFGWQISALGFEIGSTIGAFAEVGVGQLGIATVGLRARF